MSFAVLIGIMRLHSPQSSSSALTSIRSSVPQAFSIPSPSSHSFARASTTLCFFFSTLAPNFIPDDPDGAARFGAVEAGVTAPKLDSELNLGETGAEEDGVAPVECILGGARAVDGCAESEEWTSVAASCFVKDEIAHPARAPAAPVAVLTRPVWEAVLED